MKARFFLIPILLSLCLTQCLSYDLSRRNVQQGNLLPQTKIERLKKGMSKEAVAILMGSSLLSPTFNTNRWDYAYTYRQGNKTELRNLRLFFRNNALVRWITLP